MGKTKWHPAFHAAMRLELGDGPKLDFTEDFRLNEEPLEVDLLVIHKQKGLRLENGIGEFFGEHNLLEYKSPTDHKFNGFAVCQALTYAYYYCEKYHTWDVTLSMVVSRRQFNLVRWLNGQGLRCTKRHEGIYTVQGASLLRMQVIVTEELEEKSYRWLSVLTDQLTEAAAREFVIAASGLQADDKKRMVGAITQALTSANKGVFEKMKEEEDMASALFELMRPEVEKYVKDSKKESVREMIRHGDDNEYIKLIMNFTDEEIDALRKELQ